jgi:3-aminobutyryl-CoA ammonia-lyase
MTGERSVLRFRISAHDAHYGGGLVDGAHMLGVFGDVATELCILRDGDEGLFRAYDSVEFLAPVYAGDFIEAWGEIVSEGSTSRKMRFGAQKVIVPVPGHPSHCNVLESPVVVCRASGTCVVPRATSRGPQRQVLDVSAVLACADPHQSVAELEQAVGAVVVQPLQGGAGVVRVGATLLGIHPCDRMEERFPGANLAMPRGTGVDLVVHVEDAGAAARRAQEANALLRPVAPTGHGHDECAVRLRDGYVLLVRSRTVPPKA